MNLRHSAWISLLRAGLLLLGYLECHAPVLSLALSGGIVGDRLVLSVSYGIQTVDIHFPAHEVGLHRGCTLFRQQQVRIRFAGVVGMSFDPDPDQRIVLVQDVRQFVQFGFRSTGEGELPLRNCTLLALKSIFGQPLFSARPAMVLHLSSSSFTPSPSVSGIGQPL